MVTENIVSAQSKLEVSKIPARVIPPSFWSSDVSSPAIPPPPLVSAVALALPDTSGIRAK